MNLVKSSAMFVVFLSGYTAFASDQFVSCTSEYEVAGKTKITVVPGPGLETQITRDAQNKSSSFGLQAATDQGPGFIAVYNDSELVVSTTNDQAQSVSMTAFVTLEHSATLTFTVNPKSEGKDEITTMKVKCGLIEKAEK